MTKGKQDQTNSEDWEKVIGQIYDMIGANTAIINKYGIILASRISKFKTKFLISPIIWDFIIKREKIQEELGVVAIKSMVFELEKENLVFTFGENVYLLSEVPQNIDLAQFMPSVNRIMKTLDVKKENKAEIVLHKFDLDSDYQRLTDHVNQNINQERYPIFKHLVKYRTKKK